jgi:hypothetical protein
MCLYACACVCVCVCVRARAVLGFELGLLLALDALLPLDSLHQPKSKTDNL